MEDVRADLAWAEEMPLRRAAVIYDTQFGMTKRIAEALARGLRSEEVSTDVLSVQEAEQRPVDGYDLLALGCPAHRLSPTPAMRRFVETLRHMPRLRQHYAYAFECRVRHHAPGAARWVESTLGDLTLRIPRPHEAAIVEPTPGAPSGPSGTMALGFRLEPGSEARFEAIGATLARQIRGEEKDAFS